MTSSSHLRARDKCDVTTSRPASSSSSIQSRDIRPLSSSGQVSGRGNPRRSASSKPSFSSVTHKKEITNESVEFTSEKTKKSNCWEMEEMLQALSHDNRAGLCFTTFCQRSSNKEWKNGAHFWFETQQYRNLFYDKNFDQFLVVKKSKSIYARFVVSGSPQEVALTPAMRDEVRKNLDPPFEELFDDVEEIIIRMLTQAWRMMIRQDQRNYSRVELIEQERSVKISSKYADCIRKKTAVQRRAASSHPGISHRDEEEDLWSKIPDEFRDVTFDDVIKNRIELEHLRNFMEANFSKIDLLCWLDAETLKRIPHEAEEKREGKAKEFKTKYIHKKYFFGPTSPATKQEQNEAVMTSGGWGKTLKERPPNELIFQVQKFARRRINSKWLPLFLASDQYQERQRGNGSGMAEAAEDILLQKKKKRGEPWRMLDNRWQTSSRDVIEFRRGLSNRVTARQFRRFVGSKGDLLENDVLFWIEVQKYKDFCHTHNDAASIESKVSSIISCFINSQIPPTLQIDVPQEIADKIIEKRKDLGPYIFREAQLTVFRVMYPHWSGFCEFRSSVSGVDEGRVARMLERSKKRRKMKMKKEKEEQELALKMEEARIKRERRSTFDFASDVISLRSEGDMLEIGSGASIGGSSHLRFPPPMTWTYGRHMEALERKRLMMMLENEIEDRVPVTSQRNDDSTTTSTTSDSKTSNNNNMNNNSSSGRSKTSSATNQKPTSKRNRVQTTIPASKTCHQPTSSSTKRSKSAKQHIVTSQLPKRHLVVVD